MLAADYTKPNGAIHQDQAAENKPLWQRAARLTKFCSRSHQTEILEKHVSGLDPTRSEAAPKHEASQERVSLPPVWLMSILGNIILNLQWSPGDLLASYYVRLIAAASLGSHLSNDSFVALRSQATSTTWLQISVPVWICWICVQASYLIK